MPARAEPIYVVEDDTDVARLILTTLRKYDFDAE